MSVSQRVGDHIRGNVVGYVALFVALSGSALAASTVGTKNIKKNAITSKLIRDGQVNTSDVADGSITGVDLADGTVAGIDIADDGLTGADIDESTLQGLSRGVADGSIGTQQLADLGVTSAKLADGSVGTAKIEDGSIANADLSPALTIDDSRLSPNVALLGRNGQTFTGTSNAFSGNVSVAGGLTLNNVVAGAATLDQSELGTLDGNVDAPVRSVPIPVTSFVNTTDNTTLDFTVQNATSPELVDSFFQMPAVEWDDDVDAGGVDDGDTDDVSTSVTVPSDYDANGRFVLNVSKNGSSGGPEFMRCKVEQGNTFQSALDTQSVATNSQVMTFGSGFFFPVGATAGITCSVANVSGTGHYDDAVRITSAEFRYDATQ